MAMGAVTAEEDWYEMLSATVTEISVKVVRPGADQSFVAAGEVAVTEGQLGESLHAVGKEPSVV